MLHAHGQLCTEEGALAKTGYAKSADDIDTVCRPLDYPLTVFRTFVLKNETSVTRRKPDRTL